MNYSQAVALGTTTIHSILGFKQPQLDDQTHIDAAVDWLCRAQDVGSDGGVAAWYSVLTGWHTSYIETTGYIITTFLECANQPNCPLERKNDLRERAIRMGDFLLSMQHPSGGYRTHVPSVRAVSEPTVFDTGQDLLGLTDLYAFTGDIKYLQSVKLAADFLCSIQELDGSWVKYAYGGVPHTYHTRVAWGVLKVYELTKDERHKEAALANLLWCSKQQQPNGWFTNNELPPPNHPVPFTHTISYAIEGFLWSGLLLSDSALVKTALRGAFPLLQLYEESGFMPGSFDAMWHSNDRFSCLTGDAQLCCVWLQLFSITKDIQFWNGATTLLEYLKATQYTVSGPDSIRGAIAGSQPVYGDLWHQTGYCRMAYLNWSTKFFIDALLLKQNLAPLAKSLL